MQELNEVLDLYLPFVSSPNARKELINPRFHRLVMSKSVIRLDQRLVASVAQHDQIRARLFCQSEVPRGYGQRHVPVGQTQDDRLGAAGVAFEIDTLYLPVG